VRKLAVATALYLVLAIGAVATLLPFAWMLSASLMQAGEASKWPPRFLPSQATLANYRALFERLDLGRCFLNSAFVATVSTVGRFLSSRWPGMRSRSSASPGDRRYTACSSPRW